MQGIETVGGGEEGDGEVNGRGVNWVTGSIVSALFYQINSKSPSSFTCFKHQTYSVDMFAVIWPFSKLVRKIKKTEDELRKV